MFILVVAKVAGNWTGKVSHCLKNCGSESAEVSM
jgi:hypothetical protein